MHLWQSVGEEDRNDFSSSKLILSFSKFLSKLCFCLGKKLDHGQSAESFESWSSLEGADFDIFM
jgi:hypothetical protein